MPPRRSMRIKLVAFLLLALASATRTLLGSAGAADEACGATVVALGGFADVATDGGFTSDAWLYLESNGESGLQRGGLSVLDPVADPIAHDEDTCQASVTPDTLVF
ncbi:MAG: hypothetical protein ACYDCK_15075 [Thermoplasmatota archaeon]